MKRRQYLITVLFVGTLLFVLYVTFRASPKLSDLPLFPDWFSRYMDQHDEFRHFIGFGFLAGLGFLMRFDFVSELVSARWARRFRSSPHRTGRLGFFLIAIYLLELAQLAVPTRTFDWLDVINGWGGVIVAWIIWVGWKRQRRRRRRTPRSPGNVAPIEFR